MDRKELMQQLIADASGKKEKRSSALITLFVGIGIIAAGIIGFTAYVLIQNSLSENNDKILKQRAVEDLSKPSSKELAQSKDNGSGESNGTSTGNNSEELLSYGMPRSKVELLIGKPEGECNSTTTEQDSTEQCFYNGEIKSVTYKADKLESAEFRNGNILTKNGVTHS